jgi:hypothetical protein
MSSSDKRHVANGKVYWKVPQRKDLQLSDLGGALEVVEVRFVSCFFFHIRESRRALKLDADAGLPVVVYSGPV